MPRIRLAEPFEKLRDASDRALAKTGKRPKIFLANLGTPAEFNARATFAKNFFEAGGIEAVTNDGFVRHGRASPSPLPVGERSAAKRPGEGASPSTLHPNPSPGPSPAAPDRPLPTGEVKTDLAALVSAFQKSSASTVCLCSSDSLYEREQSGAAKALMAAGAQHVYLAGRSDNPDTLKAARVGTFVSGCDALAVLGAAHAMLDIKN